VRVARAFDVKINCMNFPDLIIQVLVLGVLGLGAGVLGGVIGFGTTIMLMPALVYFMGPFKPSP